MTDVEDKTGEEGENKEVVMKIASNIIEPALQKALAEARNEGSAQEVMSALANCYAGLLVDTMGRNAAATFLQGHAVHIASREEQPLTH
jgi:hypothetical protein